MPQNEILGNLSGRIPEAKRRLAEARDALDVLIESGDDIGTLGSQVQAMEARLARWEATLRARGYGTE